MIFESGLLAFLGILFGILSLYVALLIAQPFLEQNLGLTVGLFAFTSLDGLYTSMVFVGALLMGVLPAWGAYKRSLSDGLTVRL